QAVEAAPAQGREVHALLEVQGSPPGDDRRAGVAPRQGRRLQRAQALLRQARTAEADARPPALADEDALRHQEREVQRVSRAKRRTVRRAAYALAAGAVIAAAAGLTHRAHDAEAAAVTGPAVTLDAPAGRSDCGAGQCLRATVTLNAIATPSAGR